MIRRRRRRRRRLIDILRLLRPMTRTETRTQTEAAEAPPVREPEVFRGRVILRTVKDEAIRY